MGSNLETVGKIYEAFGRGDVPFILAQLADDVQWESWNDSTAQKAGVPWLAPRQGPEAVPGFFQIAGGRQITDFRVLALLDGGDNVGVEVEIAADIPATGAHLHDEEFHLWSFNAAGKMIRMRHYTDTAKHIAAAGVGQTATATS